MYKKVVWSSSAVRDFENIMDYLNDNWNRNVANHFFDLTEEMVAQISINPRQFPPIYKKEKIRKCVLTRHNTLFYQESKTHVFILRIYDTRQDPDNLTFK
jgi:plasmid stabilization system protein ParE